MHGVSLQRKCSAPLKISPLSVATVQVATAFTYAALPIARRTSPGISTNAAELVAAAAVEADAAVESAADEGGSWGAACFIKGRYSADDSDAAAAPSNASTASDSASAGVTATADRRAARVSTDGEARVAVAETVCDGFLRLHCPGGVSSMTTMSPGRDLWAQ
jgi:hypothetical protein